MKQTTHSPITPAGASLPIAVIHLHLPLGNDGGGRGWCGNGLVVLVEMVWENAAVKLTVVLEERNVYFRFYGIHTGINLGRYLDKITKYSKH